MKESAPSLGQLSHERKDDEAWLEEQFKKVETLNIEGHPLRVLDIDPLHAKSEVPVVLGPGYGASSPVHVKANIFEMVRRERRTMYIDEPRGVDHDWGKEKPAEIEEFFLRQTEALIAALDEKEIGKVDAVATSEGCMYIVAAASLYPERFRNLVLFDPGGMIGNDTFVKLGYRFLTEGLNEMKRKKAEMSPAAQQQAKEGFAGFQKYLKEDPKTSMNEVRAMAKMQIRSLLKRAHEQGVGISIVHGVDDKVFPMDRVQEQTARTTPEEDLVVDGFYSVKGTHGEFLMNPEKYTHVADIALTALEEKQKRAAARAEPESPQ